ncbi:MAG: response regulator transcription factor [Lachnospiraceae bacterium]|nr:response regulator transcription factor [Lachnospiraceae bacterium]
MKLSAILVEDSPMIIKGLEYTMEQAGFDVSVFISFEHAKKHLYDKQYDIAVLDVTLPDGTGYDLCKIIKEELKIPVIFLTAKDTENDVVKGFDVGADDYIIKPFRNKELVSRMNNALKKTGKDQRQIKIGDIELNADESRVFVKGEELEFSPLEFKLFLTLCQNAGHTMTREVLLDKIWDAAGNYVEDNTLTVYIKRIRNKLGEADIIQTIKGVGYRVDKDEQA